MNISITQSAWLHLRIAFSFFLLPVFVFAVSQSPNADPLKTVLVFIIWHFLIYPASNGYNSYFDKDEGSIALLEKPPAVDKSLYYLSLLLDIIGFLLGLLVSIDFAVAVLIYGILSKLYSHPLTRLKKYPIISFLVVFIFQGAFVYWSTYAAISGSTIFSEWNINFFLAGLICSCLVGASYPLTQVYQHEEDAARGDKTLSLVLGTKGSFLFSGLLFFAGLILLFLYWNNLNLLVFFGIFLVFSIPVVCVFINWFLKVRKDERQANFKNMTRMTVISSLMMLLYFVFIWLME